MILYPVDATTNGEGAGNEGKRRSVAFVLSHRTRGIGSDEFVDRWISFMDPFQLEENARATFSAVCGMYIPRSEVAKALLGAMTVAARDNDSAAFGGCDPSGARRRRRQRSCPLDDSSSDTTRRVIPLVSRIHPSEPNKLIPVGTRWSSAKGRE